MTPQIVEKMKPVEPKLTLSFRVSQDERDQLLELCKERNVRMANLLYDIVSKGLEAKEVGEDFDDQENLNLLAMIGEEAQVRSENLKADLIQSIQEILLKNNENVGESAIKLKDENIEIFNQSQWDEERASNLENDLVDLIQSYNQLKAIEPMASKAYVSQEDTKLFNDFMASTLKIVKEGKDFVSGRKIPESFSPQLFIKYLIEFAASKDSEFRGKVRDEFDAFKEQKKADHFAVGLQHMEELIEAAIDYHELILSSDEDAE